MMKKPKKKPAKPPKDIRTVGQKLYGEAPADGT